MCVITNVSLRGLVCVCVSVRFYMLREDVCVNMRFMCL